LWLKVPLASINFDRNTLLADSARITRRLCDGYDWRISQMRSREIAVRSARPEFEKWADNPEGALLGTLTCLLRRGERLPKESA
jgi:hypothetical protein